MNASNMFTEGIHQNIPMQQYHKDPAYSKTDLVRAERSTKYVREMKIYDNEPSAAMLIGSATHLMVLEPEKVKKGLYVTDCATRRGKKWDEEKEEHRGKIIITKKEMESVYEMVQSVIYHPIAHPLLNAGIAEASCKVVLEIASNEKEAYGLPVKCRPDYLPGERKIVDLKTTKDITPDGFGKDAYNYKYHWSAFLSCLIMKLLTGQEYIYFFVAVENKFPFETVVYRANDFDIRLAEAEVMPIIESLAKAEARQEFQPIAVDKVIDLKLPSWANRSAMVPEF